jgi:hypothetical protein
MIKRNHEDDLHLFDPISFDIISHNLDYLFNAKVPVDYTAQEKKSFYKELYDLFNKTKWKHLASWDKVTFFTRWFTAVSDKYFESCIKFEQLKKGHKAVKIRKTKNKQFAQAEKEISSWLKGLSENDAKNIYVLAFSYAIGFTPELREFTLRFLFSKKCSELRRQYNAFYSISALLPPVYTPEQKRMNDIDRPFDVFIQNAIDQGDQEMTLHINLNYPLKVILDSAKDLIKNRQEDYYAKYPQYMAFFDKTASGVAAKYPFEDWEKYLKVHLLTKQGMTIKELARIFFEGRRNISPERQISTYRRKARKLSHNAVNGIFPGKY